MSDFTADTGRHLPNREKTKFDLEKRIPVQVIWEITLACNLRCSHCGSRAGKPRANELTTVECYDLIQQLADAGTREISLIGGEAYLRRDWLDIIEAIKTTGILCILQSGGRALTREKITAAKRAGLDSLGLSIDGLRTSHDRLRGVAGSFVQATDAIRFAKDIGLNVTVNTQINRLNWKELPELLDELIALGISVWQVQLTVAMGNAADNADILLQPFEMEELHALLEFLHGRAETFGIRIDPGNNIGYFGKYESRWRSISNSISHWTGCTAGSTALGIESDGTIKGCPSLPSSVYGGGNIREVSLNSMFKETGRLKNQRDRNRSDLWGLCKVCYYADLCMAGCSWTTHVLFGRAGNNPYCIYRARQLSKFGLSEEVVKIQEAPGLPFDHGLFELRVLNSQGELFNESELLELDILGGSKIDRQGSQQISVIKCSICNEYTDENKTSCDFCGEIRFTANNTNDYNREIAFNLRMLIDDIAVRSKMIEDIVEKIGR